MAIFVVTFEDVAFSSDPGLDPEKMEVGEADARSFTDAAAAEGVLPRGVMGLAGARCSADDSVNEGGRDPDGDLKIFVSVRLLVEADDLDAAEAIDPPAEFLTRVSDMMSTEISLECNWEVLEAEPLENAPAP